MYIGSAYTWSELSMRPSILSEPLSMLECLAMQVSFRSSNPHTESRLHLAMPFHRIFIQTGQQARFLISGDLKLAANILAHKLTLMAPKRRQSETAKSTNALASSCVPSQKSVPVFSWPQAIFWQTLRQVSSKIGARALYHQQSNQYWLHTIWQQFAFQHCHSIQPSSNGWQNGGSVDATVTTSAADLEASQGALLPCNLIRSLKLEPKTPSS